jgi:NADH-quinone oxidoreductase subunit A
VVSMNNNELISMYSMLLFLFILTIGFYYEWKTGALDWD